MDSRIDFIRRFRNRLSMQTPLFKEIERHLEYQGYTVVYENSVLKTDHATKPKFWVHHSLNGAFFITIYALGAGAKSDPNALFAFLNKVNSKSIVARFSSNETSLVISVWYPNSYDKPSFSEFFDQYLADINAPPTRDYEDVRRLFWDDPSQTIPGLE